MCTAQRTSDKLSHVKLARLGSDPIWVAWIAYMFKVAYLKLSNAQLQGWRCNGDINARLWVCHRAQNSPEHAANFSFDNSKTPTHRNLCLICAYSRTKWTHYAVQRGADFFDKTCVGVDKIPTLWKLQWESGTGQTFINPTHTVRPSPFVQHWHRNRLSVICLRDFDTTKFCELHKYVRIALTKDFTVLLSPKSGERWGLRLQSKRSGKLIESDIHRSSMSILAAQQKCPHPAAQRWPRNLVRIWTSLGLSMAGTSKVVLGPLTVEAESSSATQGTLRGGCLAE